MQARDIAQRLAQQVEAIVNYLLPYGRASGGYWQVGSIDGEAGQSLKICMKGAKIGRWTDFATGQSGDLLDLWVAVHGISLKEAMVEAKQWLGIAVSTPAFTGYQTKTYRRPQSIISRPLAELSAVSEYLQSERKLTATTLSDFRIQGQQREIVFPYYRDNELVYVKYLGIDRPNGKKHIRAEAQCEPCLFGWQALSPNVRSVALTEGEIDAMTLHQYGISALSLPLGGGSGNKHQWLETEFERLAVFDCIHLCFDNDPTGHETVKVLLDRLGRHRCKVVALPYKDANSCLQAGLSCETITEYFKQAKTLDPEELKSADAFLRQVIEEFYPTSQIAVGWTAPWQKAQEKIRFRLGELSIWTGVNGHGKSQLLGHTLLHLLHQGAKVCIASLEIKPQRLLFRLTRQASGLSQPSEAYIKAIHEWYSDKLWLFDLLGTAKAKRLLEVFLYARQRYGINVFVIDSLLKLDIAEDDYASQKHFIEQLCDFKNEHPCHIHIVVHPRKGADELKAPGKLDIKGTGAITDLADNCFTVWRNKLKEKKIHAAQLEGLPVEKSIE